MSGFPSPSQFAHAAGIVALTPEGRIARYFYGIEYAPRDVRLGLVEAADRADRIVGGPGSALLLSLRRPSLASTARCHEYAASRFVSRYRPGLVGHRSWLLQVAAGPKTADFGRLELPDRLMWTEPFLSFRMPRRHRVGGRRSISSRFVFPGSLPLLLAAGGDSCLLLCHQISTALGR